MEQRNITVKITGILKSDTGGCIAIFKALVGIVKGRKLPFEKQWPIFISNVLPLIMVITRGGCRKFWWGEAVLN